MLIASNKFAILVSGIAMATLAVFVISLCSGPVAISGSEFTAVLVGQGEAQHLMILFELRLPRTIIAAAVGAMLACSGAVMQSLFRNPLADPSLIGVTAGASLGASLVIFFGLSAFSFFELSSGSMTFFIFLGALVGGSLSVFLVYRLATQQGRTSVITMLLAGIALTALVGGIGGLLEYFSDNATLRRLSIWRMGSFEGVKQTEMWMALALCALMFYVLSTKLSILNIFLLGESEARHLGVDIEAEKKQLVFLVAAATGLSIAIAGTIVFVGLIVPHICRLLVGANHHRLIIVCALTGALLLSAADMFSRIVLIPTELPVGLVITLVGAPFFIFLLTRKNGVRW